MTTNHPAPTPAARPCALVLDDASSFGALLYEHRRRAGMTQAAAAAVAQVSKSYFSAIENGRRLPPPRKTARCIARAVRLDEEAAALLVNAALRQRACDGRDDDLPQEVQLLICDLRSHASTLPVRLVSALRAKLKEVVV